MRLHALKLGLVVLLTAVTASSRVYAQVRWDAGAGTGNWGDANNWDPNAVPGTTTLLFDQDLMFNPLSTINLGGNRTAAGITFGATPINRAFVFNNNSLSVGGGGIVNNDDLTQTFNSNVVVAANQTWNAAAGGLAFGEVTVNGTLTFNGASAIGVSGTMTGAAAGALAFAGSGSISVGTFSMGTNLTLSGAGTSVATFNQLNFAAADRFLANNRTAGITTLGGVTATGDRSLSFTGSGATTVTGTISLNAGALVQNNTSGVTTIAGNNTSTGAVTVTAGTLIAANSGALGGTATGTTVASGATLGFQGGINLAGEAVSVSGAGVGSSGALRNVSGDNTLGGNVTYTGATIIGSTSGTLTLAGTQAGAGQNLTFTGDGNVSVTGSIQTGAGILTKSGTGTLTLAGANTYTGNTLVFDGVLLLATQGSVSPNQGILGDVIVGETVGNARSAILRYDNTVPGGDRIADHVAVRVNRDGLFDLNGASDLVNQLLVQGGHVTTGSGTLSLGDRITFLNASETATISGFLGLNGGVRTINVEADTTGQIDATITSGGLIKTGAGTLVLTGNSTSGYAGTTTIDAGVLSARSDLALGVGNGSALASGTEVNAGAALQLQGSITIANEHLTLGSTGLANDGGLRSVSGDNAWGGAIVLDGASRISADTGSLTLSGSTLAMGNAGLIFSGAGDFRVSNVISSDSGSFGDLTKLGTGTLFLTGANTYAGTTYVAQGAVDISHSSALGTSTGGTVVSSGAALQLQGNLSVAESFTLSGSGQFASGAIRSLSGNNTLTGSISLAGNTTVGIDSGTLTLTGPITGAGQSLTVKGNGDVTIAGSIQTGSGSLTKSGPGTLTLAGANTYTGLTSILGGTVELGGNQVITSGNTVVIDRNGTLDLNGFNQTLSSIAGTGSILLGGGTLTLTGASQWGGSFLDGGTLVLNAGSVLTLDYGFNNSSLDIVLNGGTLNINGTNSSIRSLSVTADSILDLGGSSTFQVLLGVSATGKLSVTNWVNAQDLFITSVVPGTQGQAPLSNIVFSGFTGANTTWKPYVGLPFTSYEITPIPEPEVYGAGLVAALLALAAWRRRAGHR